MKAFAISMVALCVVLLGVGLVTAPWGKSTINRVVCFSSNGTFKLAIQEERFWFDGGVIRGSDKDGNKYMLVPERGWVCSIVKVQNGQGGE